MPIHSHWAVTQVHRKHTNMTNMHFQRQITAPWVSMCTRKMVQWMQHNIGNTPGLVRSHGDTCIMAQLPFQPSLDNCFSLVIFLDHHSLVIMPLHPLNSELQHTPLCCSQVWHGVAGVAGRITTCTYYPPPTPTCPCS